MASENLIYHTALPSENTLIASSEVTEAFLEYERYRREFLYWAKRRFQGQEADWVDCYQEAWLVYLEYEKKPDFKLSCTVKTFLFAIAKKIWLKQERKLRRFYWKDAIDEAMLKDPTIAAVEVEIFNPLQAVLIQAMSRLGEKCRDLLIRSFYEEESATLIIQAMQYENAETMYVSKSRCLAQLKKQLKNLLGDNLSNIQLYR